MEKSLTSPIRLKPTLKPVIWGGKKITDFKGLLPETHPIGESWEVSVQPGMVSQITGGEYDGIALDNLISNHHDDIFGKHSSMVSFPLLIKIIDARENLSVQVHPDDSLARELHGCNGKTEMWHVIETEPGAKIYAGLRHPITIEEYDSRVKDDTIMEVVKAYDSAPGDTFYLPAGTIHAIGAGNLIAEIQQTSDITYRVFDYGRGRELHTAQARRAIAMDTVEPCKVGMPVSSPYFHVNKIDVNGEKVIERKADSFVVLMCVKGEAVVNYTVSETTIKRGETILLPHSILKKELKATGQGEIIVIEP